ncbi:OpgC protein [Pseudomonas fluorescens]|uniref:OpgC protein n=1 Tax=Pseudomonas fluorescens TaxID=294 RepID=A0A125QHG3_PSEFL|nr:OpgC protein [Pseudomonas fluorescens]
MPASNGGVWYFNPITWQCLFILGGAAALRSPSRAEARPLLRQPLFVAAALYVLVTCVITLSWRWPEVHDAWMPRVIGEWLYPISKTDLSPVRLLHFLALAYVTAKLLPDVGWTQQWLALQLARMGRYSLEVFCLSVVLAPLADMLNAMAGDSLAIKLSTALAGAVLMGLLAAWLDLNKRLDQRYASRAVVTTT